MTSDLVSSAELSETRSVPVNASRLTVMLSTAVILLGLGLLTTVDLSPVHRQPHILSWWSIAIISIAAELMIFDVEFRKELYSFTFSEIPLILGLFLASPLHLIIGRLLGATVILIVKERQSVVKLMLNLASFFGECVILLTVYQLVGSGLGIDQPLAWLQALLAIGAADLLGFLLVARVIRWHGGPLHLRSILNIGALTAPVNTSFALIAGVLLAKEPWASLLLLGIGGFLLVTYRAYSALTQRFESLSLLYDFTRLVSGAQRPDVVLGAILVQAKDLMRAERAEIWLIDERGCVGLMVDDAGRHRRELPPATEQLIERWFAGSSETTTVWTADSTDQRLTPISDVLGSRECILSPITEAGGVVGLLAIVNRLGDGAFRPQEATMFATLANHASVALENGRLIDRLNDEARQREHESLHDALTGLPNRVLFGARLNEQVGRLGIDVASLAVAVMDLDGFKEINDTLGHQSGDLVLIEAAERIRRIVDPTVVVARLGGDEFALLFPESVSVEELEAAGRAIRSQLMLPMTIEGVRINLGISIGLAIAPDDGNEAALILQRADVAMYGAKSGLGDGVNFYHVDTDSNTPRRLSLANDLHAAIENHELSLVYQPKVRLVDGVVTGFESLIRWRHPRFGNVSPEEFIPLAERTGMIQPITEFVLGAAFAQLAEWNRHGHQWQVAVNLSMRNLLDRSLVDVVSRLLAEAGVNPRTITFEITETTAMSDTNRTIAILESLSALGVRLSIDDFGTGYSSLSYLQRLPVDEVKIDKAFVLALTKDNNAEAIVRSILDLARNMDLSVVAEGIEDRQTWHMLQQLGCYEGQGYYMSRPVSPADIDGALVQLTGLELAGARSCISTRR
jgi:diguanylate cyclase (GGDEF)-like protein